MGHLELHQNYFHSQWQLKISRSTSNIRPCWQESVCTTPLRRTKSVPPLREIEPSKIIDSNDFSFATTSFVTCSEASKQAFFQIIGSMFSSSIWTQVHIREYLPQLKRISALRPDPVILVLWALLKCRCVLKGLLTTSTAYSYGSWSIDTTRPQRETRGALT